MSKNKKSNTVWKRQTIEGLTVPNQPPDSVPNKPPGNVPNQSPDSVPPKTPDSVPPKTPDGVPIPGDKYKPDYGHDTKIDKSQAEKYITDKNPTIPPNIPDIPEIPTKDNGIKELLNTLKSFNFTKLKQGFDSFINLIGEFVKNLPTTASQPFLSLFYDNFKSPEAKKDLSILASQMSLWMQLLGTYIFVLNWWYVLCYTNHQFDFRRGITNPKLILTPLLNALEFLNYPIINVRMDANVSPPYRDFMRNMWDWRPIVFTLFHMIVMIILSTTPVADGIVSNMIGIGILSGILIVLGIIYYGFSLMENEFIRRLINAGFIGCLGAFAYILFTFVFVLAFAGLASPFFILYIAFFSNLVILVFNYFWPPAIYTVVKQMFQELKESPFPQEHGLSGILKALFNNVHGIYIISIVIVILGININEALSFSRSVLMVITIIINLLIGSGFASGIVSLIEEFVGAFPKEETPVKPSESN